MGAFEVPAEKMAVKLFQLRPFQALTTSGLRDGTIFCGTLHGADLRHPGTRAPARANDLCPYNPVIKLKIVSHQDVRKTFGAHESIENAIDRSASLKTCSGAIAVVDPEFLVGYFPSIGLDEMGCLLKDIGFVISQYPSQRDHPRPVIHVLVRGLVVLWEAI